MIEEKYYEIAEKNGIPKRYVNERINRYKWSIERAITQPCKTRAKNKETTYENISNAVFYLLEFDDKFKKCKTVQEFISKLDETPNKIINCDS